MVKFLAFKPEPDISQDGWKFGEFVKLSNLGLTTFDLESSTALQKHFVYEGFLPPQESVRPKSTKLSKNLTVIS